MKGIVLQYPVYTPDNFELLSKGSLFTEEDVQRVISSKKIKSQKTRLLLSHDTVEKDLYRELSEFPYNLIFISEDMIHLFRIMNNIRVFVSFIDVLNFFRKNDYYTYRHFLVVFALTTLLAEDLVKNKKIKNSLFTSGPYHDFGKICVPLDILKKQKPLTIAERDLLRHHTIAGYTLLSYYQQDIHHITAHVALDHHERRDGSGYPRGIPDIGLVTEIVAVCDVYDALISKRPYRPVSYENRTALEEITGMAHNGQLGWNVVKAIICRNRKEKRSAGDIEISGEHRGTPPAENVYNRFMEE
ncbi:MAG: HD domain-containing protein [Spirochaetales bacterium]|nr:HD domain-containing protein [Spirochaetales bacterium]